MIEEQKTDVIEIKDLVAKVSQKQKEGCRLVQIGCVNLKEGMEINYTFDKDFTFSNLRIILASTKIEVPSISGVYWGAFTYENEIHDLFGVQVTGMNLDFKGNFYQTKVKTPFVAAASC